MVIVLKISHYIVHGRKHEMLGKCWSSKAKLASTTVILDFMQIRRTSLWLSNNKPAAQAAGQTLPDATPPQVKIPPLTKTAVTFDPRISQ